MNPRIRLRQWREQNKTSASALAIQVGCTRGFIYELEMNYSGKDTLPGLALAKRLQDRTGIPSKAWDQLAEVKHQRPKKRGAA